jgi:hypothetical protein
MNVKCVIIGHRYGTAEFSCVRVECSQDDYQLGLHYDLATEWASEHGYGGSDPFVVWDEYEAPAWFVEQFDWYLASVINCIANATGD